MSKIVRKIPATIKSLEHDCWEQENEFSDPDAYAASSVAVTRTTHSTYVGNTTVFELEEPLPSGRTSVATPNQRVYELCSSSQGEKCLLGFNEHGELKLVELGDVAVSLSKRNGFLWAGIFVLVAVLLCIVLVLFAHP